MTLFAAGDDLTALATCHREIIDTLKSGDVEAACRAARHHQTIFEHLPGLQRATPVAATTELPAA